MHSKARGKNVQPEVLRYLIQRTGEICFLRDMTSALGFDEKQIQSAIGHLKDKGNPIKTESRGQSWVYIPNGPSVPGITEPEPSTGSRNGELFECIGQTKTGKPLVRGDDGVIYVATELEI